MQKTSSPFRPTVLAGLMPGACAALLLSACGGDGNSDSAAGSTANTQASASLASGQTTLALDNVALPDTLSAQIALPLFHLAPLLLDAPADADSASGDVSASLAPHQQTVAAALADVNTTRLTVQQMRAGNFIHATQKSTADGDATPAAASAAAVTYTPAQIRAAYGMAALPPSSSGLTTAQAALLGAGQTIYIVDAQHDPNAAAELATFNQKFALPTCTTKVIAPTPVCLWPVRRPARVNSRWCTPRPVPA